MSKFYDKIILVAALVALGAGLAVYFTSAGASPKVESVSPANNPYQPLTVDVQESPVPEWPKAEPQDPDAPNEIFSIFTPPEIYLGPDGEFVFVRPDIITDEPVTAGIDLVRLEREPYRIQLEGYIEDDLEDAGESLLLFYDEANGRSIRARVGDEKADSEFKVLDFDIERREDAESTSITRIARARILDLRTGEEIVLTHGERLLKDDITIVIAVEETGEEMELDQDTQTFEAGEFTYILREINLEDSSVTVEKQVEGAEEPLIFTLQAQSPGNDAAPTPTPSTETDSEMEPGSDEGAGSLEDIFGSVE